jgi:hypothetical protein
LFSAANQLLNSTALTPLAGSPTSVDKVKEQSADRLDGDTVRPNAAGWAERQR